MSMPAPPTLTLIPADLALKAVVAAACALHTHAQQALFDLDATHDNADAYDQLEALVRATADHLEALADHALGGMQDSGAKGSLVHDVIEHFRVMADSAIERTAYPPQWRDRDNKPPEFGPRPDLDALEQLKATWTAHPPEDPND